jgi:enoyl-CoA hydratase/carnithine racemase
MTQERTQIDLGTEDLVFESDGPLAWLTFNRPQSRNAMTWAMYEGLRQACEWVDGSDETRVFLLKGAGDRAFVAGTDISQFQAFKTREDALDYEERLNGILARLELVKKPTVALIRGYAVGGGAGISLTCDLRLCTPDAQIGFPIARTLGNCLSLTNYARLVDLVGPSRAKEMIFTARLLSAEEAHQAGLANEIVPSEDLEVRGRELALKMAGHAPLTLQVTKEAIRRILADRRPEEAEDLILTCYLSEDFHEGVSAFLEKRQPVWHGR